MYLDVARAIDGSVTLPSSLPSDLSCSYIERHQGQRRTIGIVMAMRASMVVLWSWLAGGSPAGGAPDQVGDIDRSCKAIEDRKDLSVRRFGCVAPDPMKKGKWREFIDAKSLEKVESDVFEVAELRSLPREGSTVGMEITSGSGDWALFVQYCYRADGTLARSFATLNTFLTADDTSEGVSRERTRWFDPKGRQIKVTSAIRGLSTKRKQPKRQFMRHDEPIYRKLTVLPFASLLGKAP